MAWFDADTIRETFNFRLEDKANDTAVNFARKNAANDLEDWLTADDYLMAEAEAAPTNTLLLNRYDRIVNAHAFLTVYYVYLTNTQIRRSGTVGSEKDLNDSAVISYLKPSELKTLREEYLMQAKNLIAGFSTVNFSGVVETSAPVAVRSGSAPILNEW